MTQLEKLAARLKQLQNRAVTLLIITDKDGQPVAWVIQSENKIEGGLVYNDVGAKEND